MSNPKKDTKKEIRMGQNTKKLLKGFIDSLSFKNQQVQQPKPKVLSEEVIDKKEVTTDRKIRGLWENLKKQIETGEIPAKSQTKKAEVDIIPPHKTRKFPKELAKLEGEESQKQQEFRLKEASSPALGRKLGENTKKRVKNILDNMKDS